MKIIKIVNDEKASFTDCNALYYLWKGYKKTGKNRPLIILGSFDKIQLLENFFLN